MKEAIIWLSALICGIVGVILEYCTQNIFFIVFSIPLFYCLFFRTILYGQWTSPIVLTMLGAALLIFGIVGGITLLFPLDTKIYTQEYIIQMQQAYPILTWLSIGGIVAGVLLIVVNLRREDWGGPVD